MAPAGRPKLGKETRKRYNIMLEPATAEIIKKWGRGSLTAGIHFMFVATLLEINKENDAARKGKRGERK